MPKGMEVHLGIENRPVDGEVSVQAVIGVVVVAIVIARWRR
jgi:hypothetical protein